MLFLNDFEQFHTVVVLLTGPTSYKVIDASATQWEPDHDVVVSDGNLAGSLGEVYDEEKLVAARSSVNQNLKTVCEVLRRGETVMFNRNI